MNSAHDGPGSSFHFRIECKPVGGIQPVLWYTIVLCTVYPAFPSVFALHQTYIGICHKQMTYIKRIKSYPVSGGNVKSPGDPACSIFLFSINLFPGLSSIRCFNGSPKVRRKTYIRIDRRNPNRKRILSPGRSKSFINPASSVIWRTKISSHCQTIFPGHFPCFSEIFTFCYATACCILVHF